MCVSIYNVLRQQQSEEMAQEELEGKYWEGKKAETRGISAGLQRTAKEGLGTKGWV